MLDASIAVTDWYAPQWLAAAVMILILCVTDALLTLALLANGAYEANPFMDTLVHGDGRSFVAFKFGLTATGVVVLILLARVRAFGRLPVSALLYGVLLGYVWLVGYELTLLRQIVPEFLLAQAWSSPCDAFHSTPGYVKLILCRLPSNGIATTSSDRDAPSRVDPFAPALTEHPSNA